MSEQLTPMRIVVDPKRLGYLVALGTALVAVLLIYQDNIAQMADVWWRSGTFAHGMLIPPLSLWLIYQRRAEMVTVGWETDARALIVLALIGTGWAVAHVAGVLVVEQFAVVAALVGFVWMMLGPSAVSVIAFPLGFLFLAVPAGEMLTPHLVDATAYFTVAAIRLTGIPIYVEGNLFWLPTGTWRVETSCSGLRYLIAIICIALLFGYLNYHSIRRRVAFLLLAIGFALVGNWLRAFMIVMIGHLSNSKYGAGLDHVVYGWVLFGVVVFILIMIGVRWQEPEPAADGADVTAAGSASPVDSLGRVAVIGLLGFALVAGWPMYLAATKVAAGHAAWTPLTAPPAPTGWTRTERGQALQWEPDFHGQAQLLHAEYHSGGQRLGVFVAYYPHQHVDSELFNATNTLLYEGDEQWAELRLGRSVLSAGGRSIAVERSRIQSKHEDLLVWHWRWMDGRELLNPVLAKLYEAAQIMLVGRAQGAGIFIYVRRSNDILTVDEHERRIAGFVDHVVRHLDRQLVAVR